MKQVKLFDENKGINEVVKYKCKNCKTEMEKPERWRGRTLIGLILLLLAGVLPGIIFFFKTSPWICPKCQKREFLTEIYNNGDKEDIEAKPKDEFVFGFVLFIIVSALVVAYFLLNRLTY